MAARSWAKRCGRPNSSKSLWLRFMGGSHPEALSATAAVALVGVVEPEALVQAFAHEVELGAVDVGEALRIDQQLHAVVLEDDVLGRHFIDVLQLVGQARAAGGLDAQPHAT